MHALFSVLFLCIGLLFGAPCTAAAANAPSCFVYVKVLPSGEVTVVENLKGFGPKLERPLDFLDRPYSSRSPFVQEPPMEVVSVKVNGRAVAPEIVRTNVNDEVSSHLLLTSGDMSRPTHDYSVTYKTSSRVLFKSDVDRIEWDVWGRGPSGVMLSCAVSLPEGAKVSLQEARLGHETGGHRPVKSWIAKDGAAKTVRMYAMLEDIVTRDENGNFVKGTDNYYTGRQLWDGKVTILVNANSVSAADHTVLVMKGLENVTIMGFTESNGSAQGVGSIVFKNESGISFSGSLLLDENGNPSVDSGADYESGNEVDVIVPFDEDAVRVIFDEGGDYLLQNALEY